LDTYDVIVLEMSKADFSLKYFHVFWYSVIYR